MLQLLYSDAVWHLGMALRKLGDRLMIHANKVYPR